MIRLLTTNNNDTQNHFVYVCLIITTVLVTIMKVSYLVTESEGVATVRINLLRNLKMTQIKKNKIARAPDNPHKPQLHFYRKVEGAKESPVL